MGNKAIECCGISKRYVITHQERYLALRDRIAPKHLWKSLFGPKSTAKEEEFWALKNVSFDIGAGEAVGIIGRNGAGKSTLLKVLSRITSPTSGEVRIRGRVASLLEVGTGFHPELSGRENIYVNGAILGMKRGEISRQLDNIVDFAGVHKFLDTPVKRYSSGMYVRLAFAVAAHLEPEILIVDEVLAVGDAEFQKKCLGKMRDVAQNEGRTVLFVSHNMTAIQSICPRAIWLKDGAVEEQGESARVVASYLHLHGSQHREQSWPDASKAPGNEQVRIRSVRVAPQGPHRDEEISVRTELMVQVEFWNLVPDAHLNLVLALNTVAGDCVFAVGGARGTFSKGLHRVECVIPGDLLNDGLYSIDVYVVRNASAAVFILRDAATFQVNDVPREGGWMDKWPGAVRPTFFRWSSIRLDESREDGHAEHAPREEHRDNSDQAILPTAR